MMKIPILSVCVLIFAANTHLYSQAPTLEHRVDNTIRERGVVESARSSQIRSPAESKIRQVVKEGELVEEGELLLVLDQPIDDEQLRNWKTSLAKSDAKIIELKKQLDDLSLNSAGEIELLDHAVKIAELNLSRFIAEGGELALRKKEVTAKHIVAEQRLKTSKEILEKLSMQIERGISSPLDLAKLQLELLEAQKQVDIAVSQQTLFEKHVVPHETAIRELEVQKAQFESQKRNREIESQIHSLEAVLKAAELSKKTLQDQAARMKSLQITSPQAGFVVYENQATARSSRDNSIQIGNQVRENQPLLKVVDLRKLQLKVGVHESRITRVKVGQPALIRVDAFPQKKFTGEVIKISQIPETATWPQVNHKEYAVIVSIKDATNSLRLGLTALVEIDASK